MRQNAVLAGAQVTGQWQWAGEEAGAVGPQRESLHMVRVHSKEETRSMLNQAERGANEEPYDVVQTKINTYK